MIEELARLPDISFIDNISYDEWQAEVERRFTTRYEEVTGKPLAMRPSDRRAVFLRAIGALTYHALQFVDREGKQNLVKYAYGDNLDNLAAFWGLARNPAASAYTTIRFTLSEPQLDAVPIPQGTRVTNGAALYFATDAFVEVPPGDMYVDVSAICTTPGAEANYLAPGTIRQLVDPIPFVDTVNNLDETRGGSDIESDDQLRARVYLAPSSYSTAGPTDAYIYHAMAYSSAVGAVNVSSPVPGEVDVRVLLKDGSLPSDTLCAEILEYLSDKTRRPLTDHVHVMPPDEVRYRVDATYWIARSRSAQVVSIRAAVEQAVREYNNWQCADIGRDINPSELIARMMQAGAKRVEVREPAFTRVSAGGVARLDTSTLRYGEIEDD